MKGILRQIIHSQPLTYRLDIDAFIIEVQDVSAENRVLADNRRRGDEFRNSLRIRFAIIVHQPHVRARKGQAGSHSGMKAAGAACILFQTNWVERIAAPRSLGREQLARRLVGSIVDDHKLASLGKFANQSPQDIV